MDAAEGPELATVIPVYNEAEHIEACLLSLLKQTIEPSRHMIVAVSYTHLRAHETLRYLVCRLLLEKKKRHCHKP